MTSQRVFVEQGRLVGGLKKNPLGLFLRRLVLWEGQIHSPWIYKGGCVYLACQLFNRIFWFRALCCPFSALFKVVGVCGWASNDSKLGSDLFKQYCSAMVFWNIVLVQYKLYKWYLTLFYGWKVKGGKSFKNDRKYHSTCLNYVPFYIKIWLVLRNKCMSKCILLFYLYLA